MKNVDVYHDPGHAQLARILTDMPALAAYMGHSKTAAIDDADRLPHRVFADQGNRLYRLDTPKMAALSWAYAKYAMADGLHVPQPVQAAIKEALDAYGIPDSTFEVQVRVEKTAAADDCIFPEKGLYPARNAGEVKLAETALLKERSKLLPENRAAAFVRLVEKAAETGAVLLPESYKLAGLTDTDPEALRDSLRARSAAAEEPTVKQAFDELATAVHTDRKGLNDRAARVKIAQVVSDLDKKAGLQKHYDKGLPDPVATVFNTMKLAEASVSIDGTKVSFTKLMSLDPSFYGDALGDDFIPDITTGGHLDRAKLAEVIPTLPRDMQKILKTALRGA